MALTANLTMLVHAQQLLSEEAFLGYDAFCLTKMSVLAPFVAMPGAPSSYLLYSSFRSHLISVLNVPAKKAHLLCHSSGSDI